MFPLLLECEAGTADLSEHGMEGAERQAPSQRDSFPASERFPGAAQRAGVRAYHSDHFHLCESLRVQYMYNVVEINNYAAFSMAQNGLIILSNFRGTRS